MNNEREMQMFDVAGMVVFGLLGIVAFIAGCCGKYHQFWIAGICAVMFIALYTESKHTKSK